MGQEAYLADLGQHVLDTPDLTLAAKTILTAKLELLIQTLLLEGSSDRAIGLSDCGKQGGQRSAAKQGKKQSSGPGQSPTHVKQSPIAKELTVGSESDVGHLESELALYGRWAATGFSVNFPQPRGF